MSEVVDQASDEQQRAAADQARQAGIVRPEPQDCRRASRIYGNTPEKGCRIAMPAILPGNRDQTMPASPARNKWRQPGGDGESDTKTASHFERAACKPQHHSGYRSC